MASRVANSPNAFQIPKAKPIKNREYLAFIHRLPCVVTSRFGVEAAHLSFADRRYGHYGRGKGTKAPDRWALPLCDEEHTKQHQMSERDYWRHVGINPHELALTLFGIWIEYPEDEAERLCTDRIIEGRYPDWRR